MATPFAMGYGSVPVRKQHLAQPALGLQHHRIPKTFGECDGVADLELVVPDVVLRTNTVTFYGTCNGVVMNEGA